MRTAVALVEEFTRIVRHRCANDLDTWIELASNGDAPANLRSFARGLTADLAAVRAALTHSWSNGQVEGQVNRLQLVKRQMYGRANFDLLRAPLPARRVSGRRGIDRNRITRIAVGQTRRLPSVKLISSTTQRISAAQFISMVPNETRWHPS